MRRRTFNINKKVKSNIVFVKFNKSFTLDFQDKQYNIIGNKFTPIEVTPVEAISELNYLIGQPSLDYIFDASINNNFSSLTDIDFSYYDMSQIADMLRTFYNCSSLKTVNFGDNTCENLKRINAAFYGCTSIENIDMSNFKSNLLNFGGPFWNCTNLKRLDLRNINTSQVVSISRFVYGCSKLEYMDLSNFNLNAATDYYNMFLGVTTALKYIKCTQSVKLYLSSKLSSTIKNGITWDIVD